MMASYPGEVRPSRSYEDVAADTDLPPVQAEQQRLMVAVSELDVTVNALLEKCGPITGPALPSAMASATLVQEPDPDQSPVAGETRRIRRRVEDITERLRHTSLLLEI